MTKPEAKQGAPDVAPDRILRRLFWWLALRVIAVALLALGLQTAVILHRALAPESMDLDTEVAAKAEAVGTMLVGPLLTALNAGIPLDKLNGVESFLASGLQGQHDLTDIALASPDGRILWRAGVAPNRDLVDQAISSLGTVRNVVRRSGHLIVAMPLVIDGRVAAALLVGGDPDRAMEAAERLPLPVPAAILAALLIGFELLLLTVRVVWIRPLIGTMRILWRGHLGRYDRMEAVSGRSAAALLTRSLNAVLVRLQLRRAFLVRLAREARESQIDPAVRSQIDATKFEADWAMQGIPDDLSRARLVARLAAVRLAAHLVCLGLGLLSVALGRGTSAVDALGSSLLVAPAALVALLALGLLVPPSPHVGWRALIAVFLSFAVGLAAWYGLLPLLTGCAGLGVGLAVRSSWRRWRRSGVIDVLLGSATGLAGGLLLVPAMVEAGIAPWAPWAIPATLLPALILWVRQTGPHEVDTAADPLAPAPVTMPAATAGEGSGRAA